MKDFGKCVSATRDPRIVLEEQRSTLVFLNPQRQEVRKVQVDGCAIKDGERCDFLLIEGHGVEHYVELKGAKVLKAVEQIKATINRISEDGKRQRKHSYIVSTCCPLASAQIQNIKIRFKRDFNSSFQVETIQAEVTLPRDR